LSISSQAEKAIFSVATPKTPFLAGTAPHENNLSAQSKQPIFTPILTPRVVAAKELDKFSFLSIYIYPDQPKLFKLLKQ
jgi:hypothetical protein